MELNKENMKKIMLLIVFAILVFTGLNKIGDVFGKLGVLLGILFPFLLGAAMAFILNVAMQFIEKSLFGRFKTPEMKKKYPTVAKLARPVSLVLSILLVVGIVFLVMFVVLPELASTVVGLGSSIEAFMPKAQTWLEDIFENNEMLVSWIESIEFDWKQMLESGVNFLKNGAQSVVISTVAVAKTLISTITNLFIGFVFACYILLQKEKLTVQVKKAFYAFLPKDKVEALLEICSLSFKTFSNFVTGQCVEAVILGVMFFFTMTILRFPYPLLVGVLIAFTALIPIFGAFVGAAVGTFLILVADPVKAIPFIILFLVLQQIEGNLIYPHVVGNSVGLPSIWVLVAVTVGGSLMGIVGMLVFIPLTSVAYTLFRRIVYRRLEEKKIHDI